MARDYVILNNAEEGGIVAINKAVFHSIAEISINDVKNAVAEEATTFYKPINVKIEDNKLNFEVDIKVVYGANVSATCELVQNKIYENVLFMTGYKANNVAVNVTGFEI